MKTVGTPTPAIADFEKILDVPYYSQFTEIEGNGLAETWKRRSCGILSLRMVLDYWAAQAGTTSPDLPALMETAARLNAYDPALGGWKHDGLVRIAQHYGLVAWRRKWVHSDAEQDLFQGWGWSAESIKQAGEQTAREGVMSLTNAIVAGVPVIVSVPKDFNPDVQRPHLVVLTGVKKDALLGVYRGFYVNDPYNPIRGRERRPRKDEFVAHADFIHHWRCRAIFVTPEGFKV